MKRAISRALLIIALPLVFSFGQVSREWLGCWGISFMAKKYLERRAPYMLKEKWVQQLWR